LTRYSNSNVNQYLPRTGDTIRVWTMRTYEAMKILMKKQLKLAKSKIHITGSLWSSGNHKSVLSITELFFCQGVSGGFAFMSVHFTTSNLAYQVAKLVLFGRWNKSALSFQTFSRASPLWIFSITTLYEGGGSYILGTSLYPSGGPTGRK
ncbi:hypothetical protein BJ878DRAFT_530460, partial [Calycina marina]